VTEAPDTGLAAAVATWRLEAVCASDPALLEGQERRPHYLATCSRRSFGRPRAELGTVSTEAPRGMVTATRRTRCTRSRRAYVTRGDSSITCNVPSTTALHGHSLVLNVGLVFHYTPTCMHGTETHREGDSKRVRLPSSQARSLVPHVENYHHIS
jgi:hypothetical protein